MITLNVCGKNDQYLWYWTRFFFRSIHKYISYFQIFQEKLKWTTKAPKIEARNEGYVENLKEQSRPLVSL